jgi:hypothetical protein
MSRRETDQQPLPEELAEDIGRLREAIAEVRSSVVDISKLQPSPVATSSASNNNTNHFGGLGLVIAIIVSTACCTAMLTGGAVFAYMTSNQVNAQNLKIVTLEQKIAESERKTDEKLSRMQDYLNAIYSIAPQLKPKEK